MRRIVIAIGSTLTGLVLLFSWPTSLNRTVASTGTGSTAGTSTGTSSSAGTGTAAPAPTVESVTATYTGAAVSTRYGDVQVQITVTDGVITAADAIAYPNRDHQSQQISSWAVPALNDEVLATQNASIQMVSHATYTSKAYASSLQDALDQASL